MMNATEKTVLSLLLLLLTATWATAAHPEKGSDGIVFTLAAPDAGAVFLAGDFNGWNATALPLQKDGDGLWTVSLALDAGSYEYKFVVDGAWLEDPDNPEKVEDPFGGSNSKLTVGADGDVIRKGSARPTATAKPGGGTKPAAGGGKHEAGRPRVVDGGVLFTYEEKGASSVHLAGTFNGWSATDTPLSLGDNGVWSVVKPLPAGAHEYKFVVDGNWFADPLNPDTKADPYGGSNSLIMLDDKGRLIAAPAEEGSGTQANTALNARLNLNGRYLTRMETAKNVLEDPRYRMQRPLQSVDLNFDTQISDVAETYMRIRLDSNSNLIQNNVAGVLDEGGLKLYPETFTLNAYLNQEVYSSGDFMNFIGNLDHPATPGYDHLDFGKGSAGALVEADPWGIHARAFFANVHNADYYNDPDLFDNLGRDVMGVRLSRRVGRFEFAVPAFLQRDLIWMDFNELVGQTSTGIPVLDEHRARTGDSSTWYETDNLKVHGGVEAYYHIDARWRVGAQAMAGNDKQRFVTGNESGENNSNGALDLPFYDRDNTWLGLQLQYAVDHDNWARIKHVRTDYRGAVADERTLQYTYKSQAEANKNIFFTLEGSPAQTDVVHTELEMNFKRDDLEGGIWIWHRAEEADHGAIGATVPGDSTRTVQKPTTSYFSGHVAFGKVDESYGRLEMEYGRTYTDPDDGGHTLQTQELILRGERGLTRNTSVLADIRYVAYDLDRDDNPDFWSPFVGIKHQPIRNLELVLGYGVDPVDFSIDYDGRQFGRWWYRQNYLFENSEATWRDAEQALADARVFTLRAQFIF